MDDMTRANTRRRILDRTTSRMLEIREDRTLTREERTVRSRETWEAGRAELARLEGRT